MSIVDAKLLACDAWTDAPFSLLQNGGKPMVMTGGSLVKEATAFYAHSVEGLEGGT